jgi:hypothetical protein
MDINEKILQMLDAVLGELADMKEALAELQESVSNLSLPGSNYGIILPDD